MREIGINFLDFDDEMAAFELGTGGHAHAILTTAKQRLLAVGNHVFIILIFFLLSATGSDVKRHRRRDFGHEIAAAQVIGAPGRLDAIGTASINAICAIRP